MFIITGNTFPVIIEHESSHSFKTFINIRNIVSISLSFIIPSLFSFSLFNNIFIKLS